MIRIASMLLVTTSGASVWAQSKGTAAANGDKTSDMSEVISLRLSPADEPADALRYQFWPPLDQQQPTNAMPFFSRAVLMATTTRIGNSEHQLTHDRHRRWFESPWQPEYEGELREFLKPYRNSLAELDRATDRMQIDYPIVDSTMALDKMYETLLPEVQETRSLARLLRLRAKLEMHAERWDDFTRTVQTLFRLSEMAGHAGEYLVSRLVGLAIANMTLQTIEEASSLKGCPNFYWALASVPSEFLSVRDALDQEILSVNKLARGLQTNPDTPIGAVAARAQLREIIQTVGKLKVLADGRSDDESPSLVQLQAGLVVVSLADESRHFLQTETRWRDCAQQLSDSECVLRAFAIEIDRTTANVLKWAWLPDSIRLQYAHSSSDSLRRLGKSTSGEINPASCVISLVLPATSAACHTEYRWKQALATQATLQAIRDYAAEHQRLPESLNKLDLPAWPDAITGHPFLYHQSAPHTATLTRRERYSGDDIATFSLELTE
ncbi:hypothetical protein [Allorhodopirellula solitaria]|nr:hypothetical protein [Allorhodopirellula solitaria]